MFKKNNKKYKKIPYGIFCLLFLGTFCISTYLHAQTIDTINDNLKEKKEDIDTLKERIELYQNKISETRAESLSLKNHIAVLENEIIKIKTEIELSQKQIENMALEIQKSNLQIQETVKKMNVQKIQVTEFIKTIYQNDQISNLEILILNKNFSEYFDHYKQLNDIQGELQKTIVGLKKIKEELEIQKKSLEDKKREEESLKLTLENQRTDLEERISDKEEVLKLTENNEAKFSSYVGQLKQEQRQINAEIVTLEKKLREELERKKQQELFAQFGQPGFMWPTDGRYVTARFHDPDYPYRHIFEHPAIDIRAEQGTPIRAAESGYVAQAKFNGKKYAYVMIIHNDGFSTVYGHVSKIYVKSEQLVKKGDIIALSGGAPGTDGAGSLTSGPHLHFEIRLDGIPVNPLGKDNKGR
ncbi:MAG: hypothetical protein COU27_00125, partial [Candidatus Levybacteria bacterium CG10_big_fil_rev_8_21_14_0_10_36_7]